MLLWELKKSSIHSSPTTSGHEYLTFQERDLYISHCSHKRYYSCTGAAPIPLRMIIKIIFLFLSPPSLVSHRTLCSALSLVSELHTAPGALSSPLFLTLLSNPLLSTKPRQTTGTEFMFSPESPCQSAKYVPSRIKLKRKIKIGQEQSSGISQRDLVVIYLWMINTTPKGGGVGWVFTPHPSACSFSFFFLFFLILHFIVLS